MSGHSKWSTIKRDKGINDAKRGQLFTRYANAITIAARTGGSNPDFNFKLRLAVDAARAINMPKDNIDRAIKRADGVAGGGTLEEVVYEGYGPHGVALLIETVTENRQRTGSQVRATLDKAGGTLAGPGATSYLFKKQGMIEVKLAGRVKDEVELAFIDMGAEDVEEAGASLIIYTKPEELEKVREKLVAAGYEVENADLTSSPSTIVSITDQEAATKMLGLIEKLEELDDVQKVYANLDLDENILLEMQK